MTKVYNNQLNINAVDTKVWSKIFVVFISSLLPFKKIPFSTNERLKRNLLYLYVMIIPGIQLSIIFIISLPIIFLIGFSKLSERVGREGIALFYTQGISLTVQRRLTQVTWWNTMEWEPEPRSFHFKKSPFHVVLCATEDLWRDTLSGHIWGIAAIIWAG